MHVQIKVVLLLLLLFLMKSFMTGITEMATSAVSIPDRAIFRAERTAHPAVSILLPPS